MKAYRAAYSILYSNEKSGYEGWAEFAVDWDWKEPNEWARSVKETPWSEWESYSGLDEEAYRALLSHFGLENWADEFPVEMVISMNPLQLAAVRRKKEYKHHLKRKEMVSDTLGCHVSAEAI